MFPYPCPVYMYQVNKHSFRSAGGYIGRCSTLSFVRKSSRASKKEGRVITRNGIYAWQNRLRRGRRSLGRVQDKYKTSYSARSRERRAPLPRLPVQVSYRHRHWYLSTDTYLWIVRPRAPSVNPTLPFRTGGVGEDWKRSVLQARVGRRWWRWRACCHWFLLRYGCASEAGLGSRRVKTMTQKEGQGRRGEGMSLRCSIGRLRISPSLDRDHREKGGYDRIVPAFLFH